MIAFNGTELVSEVEMKMTRNAEEWAMIHFQNHLSFATFSQSAIAAAHEAVANNLPLSFLGIVKANEYQGKYYPNFNIDVAWITPAPSTAIHKQQVDSAHQSIKPPVQPQPKKEVSDDGLPF